MNLGAETTLLRLVEWLRERPASSLSAQIASHPKLAMESVIVISSGSETEDYTTIAAQLPLSAT